MERTTIARPYAQAAFEFATEQNTLMQWAEAINFLSVIASDSLMKKAISDPKISNEQLFELVSSVGENALSSDQINNFVKLLIENDRLQFAPEMSDLFSKEHARQKGVATVEVTSANALTDEESQVIAEAMQKRLGSSVEINASVDETLIGGAVIRAGDMVIDASVRGRLQKLANNFI
jgi:F-type H+-transporting ATPase subunit delta